MPPFTILHVCVGNICRSPMAERLLVLALRRRVGEKVERLYVSHGAGTGSWHVGEPMNAPAARQLALRGGLADGFQARRLSDRMIDHSDLILGATAEQVRDVLRIRPDAVHKTFVLGEFGRLLKEVDPATLAGPVHERGEALVRAVDAVRDGRQPERGDDLDDPWGRGDQVFSRVADEIQATVGPLAKILIGK